MSVLIAAKLYWTAVTSGHSGTIAMRCSQISHSSISLFTDHKTLLSMQKNTANHIHRSQDLTPSSAQLSECDLQPKHENFIDTCKNIVDKNTLKSCLNEDNIIIKFYMCRAGPNGTMHCRKEDIPQGSEFPKVWEWLTEPGTTKEEKTVNGTEYIFYTGHVSFIIASSLHLQIKLAKFHWLNYIIIDLMIFSYYRTVMRLGFWR